MNDESKARYGMMTFQAKNLLGMPLGPGEYLDFCLNYYKKHNNNERLMTCYLYKAGMHSQQRQHQAATQNLLKAKDLADPSKDFYPIAKICTDLGQICAQQGENDRAIHYFKLAAENMEKANKSIGLSKVYVILSWTYMAKEEYDSAIYYSRKILGLRTLPSVFGDALNDIGRSYMYLGQNDSSIIYTRESLEYPAEGTNLSMRLYNMANSFFQTQQYDSAKVYLMYALQQPIDVYIEEECYRILTKVALEEGDTKRADHFLKVQRYLQDSIRLIEQQSNVSTIEQMHETEKVASKALSQRQQLIILVICLSLIALLIVWLLYRRNRQKQREAEIYKGELEKKNELMLLNLTDELERTRIKYSAAWKKADFQQREEITKKIYDEVLQFEDEEAFLKKMNKVLNNLPQKLKEDHPDINYKEILWCCLFILQIPTPDMCLILNYMPNSLYKFKQRLVKKLNFNNANDLEQMLYDKMNI